MESLDEFLDSVLGGGVNHAIACTGAFHVNSRTFEETDFLENRPDKALVEYFSFALPICTSSGGNDNCKLRSSSLDV